MIMKLTDKTKNDFDNWLYENYDKCQVKPQEEIYWHHFSNELTLYDIYEKLPLSLKQQLIIEFFDSVGYNFNVGLSFIKTKPYKCELYISSNDNILGECYEFKGKFLSSKQIEATEQAIIKANEIYNETKV